MLVPLLLEWLGNEQYGIWLTIQAVIGWFMLFDLGLGNGLRNKLAETLADDKRSLARTYVSTAYFIITVIGVVLFFVFLLARYWIDWAVVFNAPEALRESIATTMTIVFAFFSLQFVFQLVKMVLMADQRPADAALINTIGTLFALVLIVLLMQWMPGNLVAVAGVISGANVVVLLLANWWVFRGKYRWLRPQWSHVSRSRISSLTGLGFRFFILQGAALIVFATDNMIITQMIGPEAVPAYNIAFKYFNLMMVFFTLLTVPYWSAFTEAYQKGDIVWIRRTVRTLLKVWGLSLCVLVLMVLIAPLVYQLWVGDRVVVEDRLSLIFAIWVALQSGVAIFSNFLSGIGKIGLSVYHALFVTVVNIPLSIWLAGPCGLGSAGVILASVIGMLPRVVFQPLQYSLIISGKARGIWNR